MFFHHELVVQKARDTLDRLSDPVETSTTPTAAFISKREHVAACHELAEAWGSLKDLQEELLKCVESGDEVNIPDCMDSLIAVDALLKVVVAEMGRLKCSSLGRHGSDH